MFESQRPSPEPAGTVERELRTESGDSEQLLLTAVGDNLFQVEESSFITDAVYRDVIRAREMPEGVRAFVEVAERSPLITNSWILSQDTIESEAMKSVLARLMAEGGNWEQVFGGGLIVHTSPATARQIEDEVLRIANSKQLPPA
jgi:hypothetical protein